MTADRHPQEHLNLPVSRIARAPALVAESGDLISYGELDDLVTHVRRRLDWPGKALVAVFCDRDLSAIVAYLGCLSAGHACAFAGDLPRAASDSLIGTYRPEFIVSSPSADGITGQPGYAVDGHLPGGAVLLRRTSDQPGPVAPQLALLLTTSGSTGSPVLVRLSYANLAANTSAIIKALAIGPNDRAITSLPLSHCYGLSVLNTHLAAGASVAICAAGVLGRRFWQAAARHDVSTFAGVPASYEMLRDRGFTLDKIPSLHTLQCSGGAVRQDVVQYFATQGDGRATRFWVMYGQTEATARISCLHHAEWRERAGSVGRVIPGGRLRVVAEDGSAVPDGVVGMVEYSGPSVMLGYARTRSDLGLPDEMSGTLATGDLGYLRDGYLYLTGRVKRIVKVLGHRVELDEVERLFADPGGAFAVQRAADTIAVLVRRYRPAHEEIRMRLLRTLGLPPAALIVAEIGAVPHTRSGKPDYPALRSLARTLPRTRAAESAKAPGVELRR